MAQTVSIAAIITARGGSKGLPRKNLRHLNGVPLIAHTIRAATGCALVTATFVTTEDPEIANVAQQFGADVIPRPDALASDHATSAATVEHALQWLAANKAQYDYFALLQPTSPLRTAAHLTACCSAFLSSGCRSAISVCKAEHPPQKYLTMADGVHLHPLANAEDLHRRRQDLPQTFRQNGAIYLAGVCDFLEIPNGFFRDPCLGFVMSQEDSVDIDGEVDLIVAEFLLTKAQPI